LLTKRFVVIKSLKTQLLALINDAEDIEEATFTKVTQVLKNAGKPYGVDEQGRLNISFFDAKAYDRDVFDRENKQQHNLIYHTARLGYQTAVLAKGSKVVCIFVNDICDGKVVEALAKQGVELIVLRCAGFNNVDLDACKQHSISVARVPAYSPSAVAEHTLALMLMLNRNLHRAYLRNRAGQFTLDGLVGFNMKGKTVGVIGTGKIGQCVIDILLGFGCKILAFDIYPNASYANKHDVTYVALNELLASSHIVTLHAPLSKDTYHCINENSIANMKQGAMLINTSRGGLIDTKALIQGLKSKKISAAGLDVYEEEADIFFQDMSGEIINDDVFARLLTFNNVVITSHQAFLTHEALQNIADTTLENIKRYAQGKEFKDIRG